VRRTVIEEFAEEGFVGWGENRGRLSKRQASEEEHDEVEEEATGTGEKEGRRHFDK